MIVVDPQATQHEESMERPHYTPLPNNSIAPGDHRGTFGRSRFIYQGKHSEGNRFIRNNEL